MKIILDTNILRQDFFIKSRKFEMLIDFVSKTEHEIILPQVVYDEILSLYERTLLEKYGRLIKSKKDCEKILSSQINLELPNLDLENQMVAFEKNLTSRLKLTQKNIIPLNNDHLPDLVNRAIKRIAPFMENKSEFRDAIIWLSALEIAQSEDEKAIILISANTKDFAEKDDKLHPKLFEEANKKKLDVHYFSSLDNFLKSKASTIEFINEQWLEENIDFKKLEEDVIFTFELYKEEKLSEIAKDENDAFEEILSVIQCTNFWINDFYVYEMVDGSIRVEVTLESELEVEYATHEVVKSGWEMDYVFDPLEGDFDFDRVHKRKVIKEAGYDCIYPIVELELHLLIKKKKIESIELVDWYV